MSLPVVFGILNVTPDSFSDGGRWNQADAAIEHGTLLASQGADVIDVGGESTRPGADRVPVDSELQRVLPVVRELAARGIAVSIDTMNAVTAAAAIEAGAAIVNDVSGGLADPEMFGVIAGSRARYVLMHWRGHSIVMDDLSRYGDVVTDVRDELAERLESLLALGVQRDRVILDPGLGFAKTAEHNWQLLARLPELGELGCDLLVGASRKRFLAPFAPEGAPPSARDAATSTISALSAAAGVWGVRVHDVPGTITALNVWAAWEAGARDD